MNLKPSTVAIAAACLCGLAQNAQAQEWKFSGFGTVSAVHSSEKDADYTTALYQEDGSGHSADWSTNTDTKLGLQLDVKFSPQWSAAVQGISKYRAEKSYKPALSLGFVKYAPGAGVEIRAGRLPYAAFLVSDYLNIGYSQPWVRPPIEVYDASFDYVDGADITWRTSLGPVGLKTQVLTGSSKQTDAIATLIGKGFAGINLTADVGDFSTRLSYINVRHVTLTSPAFEAAFNAVRFAFHDAAEADEYEVANKTGSYLSLGMTYDPGNWFVTGEYGHLGRAGFSSALNEFYVTGGLRIKAFTPYISVAQYKHVNQAPATNFIVQNFIDTFASRDEHTFTAGMRWDFAKSADLKIQYDRIHEAPGSAAHLSSAPPNVARGGQFGVVSVSMDFVF